MQVRWVRLSTTIKDTNTVSTTDGSNNDIDNKVDIGTSGASSVTIKDADIEPIAGESIMIQMRRFI